MLLSPLEDAARITVHRCLAYSPVVILAQVDVGIGSVLAITNSS